MGFIKKSHDKLDKVGKVDSKFVKFANFAMQIFLCLLASNPIRQRENFSYSLYIV